MSSISPGTILLGIVAVMFGLLGAFLVQQNLKTPAPETEEQVAAEPETVTVPMASTELKAGRKITLGDIAIYRMNREQLAARGINGPFMNNTQQIIGRVLKEDLAQDSIFETSMFFPEGLGPGIGEQLEPGQRAITVPVEMDAAVAGFAVPGTWVDVLFRSEANKEKELPETTVTLLERVKVLALNEQTFEGARRTQAPGNNRTNSTSVTLAVSPQDVNALRVVSGRGALSLALRNPEDEDFVKDTFPRTLDELLNIPSPERHRIEVFRGRRISSVEFDNRMRSENPIEIASSPQQVPANEPARAIPVSNKK